MSESFSRTQAEIIQGLREIVPATATLTGETRIVSDLHLDSLAGLRTSKPWPIWRKSLTNCVRGIEVQ